MTEIDGTNRLRRDDGSITVEELRRAAADLLPAATSGSVPALVARVRLAVELERLGA